ncbi:hypothetical protein DITRI_Ditri08aG0125700 [Diplodiscus trichospermus]
MENLKKIALLFMVSAFLLSTSMVAGRQSKFVNMLAEEVNAAFDKEGGEATAIHERVLRANTEDYGRYDPSPSVKPPFKPIPN